MTLQWFITNYCNLSCLNCSSACDKKDIKYFSSLEEIEYNLQLIKTKNLKFSSIDLTGGEALLHPDIKKICFLIKTYFPDIHLKIYSNGLSLKNFSDDYLSFLNNLNIELIFSIYPREQYFKEYEIVFNRLKALNIEYNFSQIHFLFNQSFFNKKNTNINSIICPMRSNQCATYFLRNGILHPCCVSIEKNTIKNSFLSEEGIFLKNISSIQDINLKQDKYFEICSKCTVMNSFTHPWHNAIENRFYTSIDHFDLYKNQYDDYYNLYHAQDQELYKIIQHPLINTNLNNEDGLFEKHYIDNKFINGILDVLIFYNQVKNIDLFIDLINKQKMLHKCNLYFIKDNKYSNMLSDEIFYNNFFPFKSLQYNSYFFQANSFIEAKEIFNNHSFLQKKLILNVENYDLLKDIEFFYKTANN